ncbi:MAG: hypothetical protein AABY74_00510 [Planctomycetota bacterium]
MTNAWLSRHFEKTPDKTIATAFYPSTLLRIFKPHTLQTSEFLVKFQKRIDNILLN